MGRQERVQANAVHEQIEVFEPERAQPSGGHGEASGQLGAHIDAVLDDIDAVLAGNAEEFVANFVQKGGQ